MKCHGRFKMRALTYCDAEVMSTRTTAGQFKGQFKGVLDERSRTVQKANKRQTHCVSPIIVHIGVDQRCCAEDVESPAILPTMSTQVTFQRGDG